MENIMHVKKLELFSLARQESDKVRRVRKYRNVRRAKNETSVLVVDDDIATTTAFNIDQKNFERIIEW